MQLNTETIDQTFALVLDNEYVWPALIDAYIEADEQVFAEWVNKQLRVYEAEAYLNLGDTEDLEEAQQTFDRIHDLYSKCCEALNNPAPTI